MFTLIKREISDNLVYFVAAAALSALMVFLFVTATYRTHSAYSDEMDLARMMVMPLSIPLIFLSMIGTCAMGSSQMYTDKHRRVSALLTTLPMTRSTILIARVLAGLLAILILLVPIALTAAFTASIRVPPLFLPLVYNLLLKGSVCVLLLYVASYCIGLQTGWTGDRVIPTLGALVLSLILLSIFTIKGLTAHTVVILTLFVTASIIRTWVKFTSASL